MRRERERKEADPSIGEKLNGLVERIFAKRVGSRKREIEDCGERASVERGSCMIQENS